MTEVRDPTPQHERAAAEITSFFREQADTQAVLLTNSCARGKATPDSCLDLQVVTQTERVAGLDQAFRRFAAGSAAVAELNAIGRWADVHLDVHRWRLRGAADRPRTRLARSRGRKPPRLLDSVAGSRRSPPRATRRMAALLRRETPCRAAACGRSDVSRLPRPDSLVPRPTAVVPGLARLHGAFSWFLLALHRKHRTYPIAYDSWIREQIVENPGMPQLYDRLPALFEIAHLESRELDQKAADLRALADTYLA